MKNLLVVLLFAACGYAAYDQVQSLEKRLADAQAATTKADADNAALEATLQKSEIEFAKIAETLAAEKQAALDDAKAKALADIDAQKAVIENEITALGGAPDASTVTTLRAQITDTNARADALKKPLQDAVVLNAKLAAYVSAEELKGKVKYTEPATR